MRQPRFSIGFLAYLVLIATLNLAWVIDLFRQMSIGRPAAGISLGWVCVDAPVLGLANVLAVLGYPLLIRGSVRPFRAGFVVGGLLGSALYIVFFRSHSYLAFEISVSLRPLDQWFGLTIHRPEDLRFVARYLTLLALMALAGVLPFAAFAALFGLLARLAAKGRPIPRTVTLAMAAVLFVSTWMMLRRITYQEQVTRCDETCRTLSAEANVLTNELERALASERPSGGQARAAIETIERELSLRKSALAKFRRYLETYQRAADHPWLPVSPAPE